MRLAVLVAIFSEPVELRRRRDLEIEVRNRYKLPSSHPTVAPSGMLGVLPPSAFDSACHDRINEGDDCEKLDTTALWAFDANVRDKDTFITHTTLGSCDKRRSEHLPSEE